MVEHCVECVRIVWWGSSVDWADGDTFLERCLVFYPTEIHGRTKHLLNGGLY